MRISLNWLRELVELTREPESLAETLTMAGFEVEEIEDRRSWADGVVVGKIIDAIRHPNADKLQVCQVDIGAAQPLQIVCGAANAKADIYVPVATVGTYLPKIDLKIKRAKLRGVASEGMICSLAELGLEKKSAGIHIFDRPHLQVGSDARPLLGLDDVVLDLTSTANRADALSMVGVAREVAALTGGTLKLPAAMSLESTLREPSAIRTTPDDTTVDISIPEEISSLQIEISQTHPCLAYIGTVLSGIKIGPAPRWLQQRLLNAGVRPINNVVDVTNYIMLEWGQPLHAFDLDRLQAVAGGDYLTIGVRYAHKDSALQTLDSEKRTLQAQNLLITANDKPVALAGIMGGSETEVDSETRSIVLEAALFDPAAIRSSARTQGLRTEASARYERGVNQAELEVACSRAVQLLTELASAKLVAQAMADSRPEKSAWSRKIELRQSRVYQVLGGVELDEETIGEIPPGEIERILQVLGCQLTPNTEGVWTVTVPPYRYRDLEREIDLIEEIARVYGYDNFCSTLPTQVELGFIPIEEMVIRRSRAAFRAAGLTELMHYSYSANLSSDDRQVNIANPLFTEYSSLRTELLSGLIKSCQYNLEQGNGLLNGFEIGRIFWRSVRGRPEKSQDGLMEAESIAGIMGGDRTFGKWTRGGREQPMTWYEAKGVLETVFERLGCPVEYQPDRSDDRLHPGRTASLWLQGERLGVFGQLHPQLRFLLELPDAVYGFELDFDLMVDYLSRDSHITPMFSSYSTYPASDRDIAFFVPLEVSVADISREISKAGGSLLASAELFDEYRGDNVSAGQRSLAFRLIYRTGDRTLTESEVELVHQNVRDALVSKFCVSLRS
ncbi:MAG: phenylalanine--tRNA ligase subunit beta [Hormoscilla sp. GM102CHS1]|nr:phenylalanine--tRNA ligase subunit beta [Hormoscilla sp. GM102CHS1]